MDCKNINLKRGSTGPLVNELEHYLHPLGLYPYKYDTIFGKGVEDGVIARQAQLKLKTDGIFGPISCVAFELNDKPTPTVQYRPVVICSDNINGIAVDKKRINDICEILTSKGLKCSYYGIGPNTHIQILQSSSTPSNCLVVDIYGGADSGLIYEMAGKWYKSIKGNRKVFTVFCCGAKKITGLDWLARAHDDNYDPASFTGISHPDQFLNNNGYNFIESSDVNQIAAVIIKEAIL
jgi:hypothetical protein